LGYQLGVTRETEQDLRRELEALEKAVAEMPTANPKPDLAPRFKRIDDLAARLPAGTDPRLRHYLRQKSYRKARLFLEGREAENQAGDRRHVE